MEARVSAREAGRSTMHHDIPSWSDALRELCEPLMVLTDAIGVLLRKATAPLAR